MTTESAMRAAYDIDELAADVALSMLTPGDGERTHAMRQDECQRVIYALHRYYATEGREALTERLTEVMSLSVGRALSPRHYRDEAEAVVSALFDPQRT